MDLLLTDRLACPRCGPEFGLILLANSLEDRRAHEGSLGCANCRDAYPIVDGAADLRPAPRLPLTDESAPDVEGLPSAAEIGALLGVLRGPGHLAVVGRLALRAPEMAGLIDEIEMVTLTEGLIRAPEQSGVSRVSVSGELPFQTRVLRGIALFGDDSTVGLAEAARVLSPGGRVAVFAAGPDTAGILEAEGLTLIAEDGGRVVARR